jgi:hypothetical protein
MKFATSPRLIFLSFLIVVLCGFSARAHDSIDSEAREHYLSTLHKAEELTSDNSAVAARAKALYQIAITLDEIRDLFNQDIISHGRIMGLETSMLIKELSRAGYTLELSAKTGLYLSHLQYYREAMRLEPKALFGDHARYMLLKSHFYDSFSDDPMAPISQSKETLLEMLAIAENLLTAKDSAINAEEVRFILAIHYLQAIDQRIMAKDLGRKKFDNLLQELRKDYPQSLKPLTLEALAQ